MTLLLTWLVLGHGAVVWAALAYGLPARVAYLDLAASALAWPVFLVVIRNRGGWRF